MTYEHVSTNTPIVLGGTDEQHGKLLEQSGLGPIMKTFRTRPPDVCPIPILTRTTLTSQTPLARLPATSAKSLTSSLSQFSQFLTSLDVLTTPRLALLSSSKLAEKVHRSALYRISQAYGEVCDRVLDKKEGYEFAETLLRRGKDEVAVALGVDGDDSEFSDTIESMGKVKASAVIGEKVEMLE
jgi:hypothetical protein